MADSLELGDDAVASAEEEEHEPKFQTTGGAIKEELSSLIKQNPDAAANLLRAWIGEAA
jgi:flagellar M-ring protein FliF